MTDSNIDWLCRPIAHRGFHNRLAGIIENSYSAILAAIERNYAIEVDLQASKEFEPVVFHDKKLNRLTHENGKLRKRTLAELKEIQYKDSDDRIICLRDLLEIVNGQVPLLIEIKGKRKNAKRFGRRVGEIIRDYQGPVAVMSFKPELVEACIETAPDLPRGLTVSYIGMPIAGFTTFLTTYMGIGRRIKPQFIAYDVRTLPGMTAMIVRQVLGLKLFAWTVRKKKQRLKADRWADAMIFEGFEV